jgi:hypothetical protein
MVTQILETVGKTAGLGGLSLGVFLLLFRKISLPKATRKHLTLFMWLVWSVAILGLICFVISQVIGPRGKVSVVGDFVAGDKVSYKTYITHVTKEGQSRDNVSDVTLLNFFYQYSSAFNQAIVKVPRDLLQDLPGFLQKPYSMNVVVSECHGVGFEYTVPTNNPEITLIHTTAPIERHFFTKYTGRPDFTVSSRFIKVSRPDILWANFNFVGSKQVFWVTNDADVQVADIGIRYSGDDELKTIGYVWLFASNSNEYWGHKDPVKLANENAVRLIKMYRVKREAEASYSLHQASTSP